MQNVPPWKPVLIVVVLALCGLSLYPPSQRLKPGIDLAGGTTLVYQVDVPANQDAQSVIDQVIETLKKRVDPNGVRNLIWRRQAGNRIEIQMPLPPAHTGQRRAEYLKLRDELVTGNIKKREINSALRLDPSQRPTALDRLAGQNEHRRQLLDELATANDLLELARQPYEEAQKRLRQLEAEAADPGPQRDERLKTTQDHLTTKTRAYLNARNAYTAAQEAVLATNIDPNELEQILGMPEKPRKRSAAKTKNGQTINPRAQALDRLIAAHPDRADALRAITQTKALYDEVRGPLDDPNDLITLLRGSGVLEFRIAANTKLPDAQAYLEQLAQRGPKAGTNKPYRWMMIDDPASFAGKAKERKALEENPQGYFTQRGLVGQLHGGEYYLLLANTPDLSLTQSQENWKLAKAYSLADENGFPAVGFELNRVGGQFMGTLTGNNKHKPMAIMLDGRVISAPSINDRIQDKGIITGGTGGFSQKEQSYLIRTFNAGSLQGRLSENPISIKKFGPQLGQDNLNSGLRAAVWALIAVALFMAVYYLLGGFVANFALAANMVIILGAMAMFGATFTLPGIAGIVLTIGMAVDANVLIFERIREELEDQADIRTAVRLGYDKALSTIIDANVTTLITCVILNYTATAEIKGFAITLMIGILATMFTALFCTRVILDIYLNLSNARTIPMLPTLIPAVGKLLRPNINWAAKRYLFFGLSGCLMVLGVYMVSARGQEMLDIEFRSGTQVTFELADGQTLSLGDVRQRLTQAADQFDLPQLAGDRATVVTVGETRGTQASEFSVATLQTDADAVSKAIKEVFVDVLDTHRPIAFQGMGPGHNAPPVSGAPVYAIRSPDLGDTIHRPDVHADVTDFLGGVAVVLSQMQPAPTLDELTERIGRMRMQPAYEGLGYRASAVIGLDLEPAHDGQTPRYRSAAVVVSQTGTNYIDSPDTLTTDAAGLAATEWRLIRDALQRDTSLGSVANFSSQVSNTMRRQAIVALTLSLLAVVAYIWFRFGSLRYGLAAIVALVHDVTVTMGLVALVGLAAVHESALGQTLMLGDFKINLALVAAMLTIVGYSLNDTIVIFDRIRENRGRLAFATEGIINDSINQTISRTIITSLTTLMALGTLYIFGGAGVHGFAFAMLVGVLVGTYSSIAIAAPVVLILGAGVRAGAKNPQGQAKATIS